MVSFYGCDLNISMLQEESLLFLLSSQEALVFSFDQPRKNESLSRPWSHPVVSNLETLDWESSVLATKPLLH